MRRLSEAVKRVLSQLYKEINSESKKKLIIESVNIFSWIFFLLVVFEKKKLALIKSVIFF